MLVDLTKCDQVAKRELAYLHDIQLTNQELLKAVLGLTYYTNNIVPKLTKEVKSTSDYLEQVN